MQLLITPPIRSSLLTQKGIPFSTENGDIQTAREWWLYWNNLGDRANENGRLVSGGTHGDRPVPDGLPDGAIYIESDRGVIYQLQEGDWVYVAGVMYGTISPDQRPTDLGPNDFGFVFTATDPLASDTGRTFVWSGTAWIETTPVLYGTHANRPAPAAAPARCLYVEGDRGPMFQNQLGHWVYIAGTMWGTLSPDQRPTDLGIYDAGFTFRTNVAPPREFIWSGTAWVETTPVTGDVQIAYGSSSIALTTTAQDLPGLTLTLNRAGLYHLIGVFDLRGSGAGDLGALLIGQLVADGAVQPKLGFMALGSAGNQGSVSQQWIYTAPSPGKVCKLQAWKTTGSGGSFAAGESTLTAVWISN